MLHKKMKMNLSKHPVFTHTTKKHALKKFILILSVFLLYFLFITYKYGLEQGFFVSLMTWSFFVLCTPIADAGFLIDFPIRLITNMRMYLLEIIVWIIAISLNTYAYFFMPAIYEKTPLLSLFKHILNEPFPFWIIIILSFMGTFLSITFGDELLDKTHHHERKKYHTHKNKHRAILMIFLFAITFVLYTFLLKQLGLNIPLSL